MSEGMQSTPNEDYVQEVEDALRDERRMRDHYEQRSSKLRRQLDAVLRVHVERVRLGDGYSIRSCVEDGWAWPCPTIQAVEEAGRDDVVRHAVS